MANYVQHRNFGLITSFIIEIISIIKGKRSLKDYTLNDGFNFFVFMFGSYIGSMTPDVLEPPGSPYHRKTGHSIIGLIFSIILLVILFDKDILKNHDKMKSFLKGFLTGYSSHLVLDSTTFMGLPII
jgi:membrane-bound metal-dependent hydrolase YbcI (DUF457 family)